MSWLIVLPVVIPLTVLALGVAARGRIRLKMAISVIGGVALLVAAAAVLSVVASSGPQAVQLGNWPAPFGVSFVADGLSSLMLVVSSVIFFAVTVYSIGSHDKEAAYLDYFPLLHALIAGVNGSFLTGDLFNLYVWFEVMLISSFVLLSLGRDRRQIGGAVPYVSINLVGSAIFLVAVGLLYGSTGALNFAELSVRLEAMEWRHPATAVSALLFVAFGIKAAVFPVFFWLPASYHTPPIAVSALFAGLLTKVGVYALIRTFTLLFPHAPGDAHAGLMAVSALTMVFGVFGAMSQGDVRKILSFHIISQIGYMTLGLAINTRIAIAGAVFYIVHHIIVKANLFLIAGLIRRAGGSYSLARVGGLMESHPWLAVLFVVPAFSLAGIPPLSGFWGKYILAKEAFGQGHAWIAAISLATGMLTLYSMTKIWGEAFWKPAPKKTVPETGGAIWFVAPSAVLAALTVWIGLNPDPLLALADRAAAELLERPRYIEAVLGEGAR